MSVILSSIAFLTTPEAKALKNGSDLIASVNWRFRVANESLLFLCRNDCSFIIRKHLWIKATDAILTFSETSFSLTYSFTAKAVALRYSKVFGL